MPRISEIPSSSTFERSGEQGITADSGSRKWRIILDNPGDSYDVQQMIGVRIGDFHPLNANIPCVSISEAADGESRLVRVVTATYKTAAGGDAGGGAGSDPGGKPPDIRPAKISLSSSLIERPARVWWKNTDPPADGDRVSGKWIPVKNPVGDLYDGVTRVVALVNISVTQYEPEYKNCRYVGDTNSDDFFVQGMLVPENTCMLRGYTLTPHVETWGERFFRGWLAAYEFTIDWSDWLVEIPLSGFNVKNDRLNAADVENDALTLVHKNYKVDTDNLRLVPDKIGSVVRASVAISAQDGGWMQRPSSLPVILNEDGTPRKRSLDPIIKKYGTTVRRTFGNNFSGLGIRINEAL